MARTGLRPIPAMLFAVTFALAAVSVPISVGREALYDALLYPAHAVGLSLAGALVASYQPRNPIGWVLCAIGCSSGWVELTEGYGYHARWPSVDLANWFTSWGSMLGIGGTAIVLTLFPSGRNLSRGRRLLVAAGLLAAVLMAAEAAFGHSADAAFRAGRNPYALADLQPLLIVGRTLFSAVLVTAIVVLLVRFRRAHGVERQQLKWVAYVVSLLLVVGPAAMVAYDRSAIVRVAIAVVVTALPIAICAAILRFRLYDIDVIINRTLVYGVVTVLLAAAYLTAAFVLGALLGGRHSAWVTAGATLAAGAAFRPVRAHVQDAVDRRFRRARYEALARVDVFLDDVRAGRAEPESVPALLRELTGRSDLRVDYLDPSAPVHLADGAPEATARLVKELTERAGLAIEIARLRAEVRHQLAEVEASRARIVAAGYEERRRLERDLHDGAQQRLVSVGLTLRHAQFELGDSPVVQTIEAAVGELADAITDLRELANGVRPAHLDNGLELALRELAGRTPVPVDVHGGPDRFPADVEATAYFVACEALANAVKHADATAIEVRTVRRNGRLVITVCDDGVGGAEPAGGTGIRGLADRVAALGGRIHVDSPLGRGTTLTAELPCAS